MIGLAKKSFKSALELTAAMIDFISSLTWFAFPVETAVSKIAFAYLIAALDITINLI